MWEVSQGGVVNNNGGAFQELGVKYYLTIVYHVFDINFCTASIGVGCWYLTAAPL
jgi:hypothetical protein